MYSPPQDGEPARGTIEDHPALRMMITMHGRTQYTPLGTLTNLSDYQKNRIQYLLDNVRGLRDFPTTPTLAGDSTINALVGMAIGMYTKA